MICKVCQSDNIGFIYCFNDGPAMQQKLHDTLESALAEKKAPVNLYGCRECGFVFNADFDDEGTEYSADYDNTQNYSEHFNAYTAVTAKGLISKYGLKDKEVIEVGCGKGDFLKLLYRGGVSDIKGFDPAYVDSDPVIDGLITKQFFDGLDVAEKADFIVCRNVLEHVKNPVEFVGVVSDALSDKGVMYFELPALDWIIENESFFDFYYEHCNYFSKSSLARLFEQCGFLNIIFHYGFHGQYFELEARRGNARNNSLSLLNLDSIPSFISRRIGEYKKIIATLDNFVIWGAGAKGVTFLTRLGIDSRKCKYAIDINPDKESHFIPITGQKIVPPNILTNKEIDCILIMNPAYEKEIKTIASSYNYTGRFILVR